MEGSGFQSLALCPHFSFQFDLQRIVIYCDSRHAELETCCDIPSGPVSRDSHTARPAAEERVPRPRPLAGRGFSGPRNWGLGERPLSACGLEGARRSSLGVSFRSSRVTQVKLWPLPQSAPPGGYWPSDEARLRGARGRGWQLVPWRDQLALPPVLRGGGGRVCRAREQYWASSPVLTPGHSFQCQVTVLTEPSPPPPKPPTSGSEQIGFLKTINCSCPAGEKVPSAVHPQPPAQSPRAERGRLVGRVGSGGGSFPSCMWPARAGCSGLRPCSGQGRVLAPRTSRSLAAMRTRGQQLPPALTNTS